MSTAASRPPTPPLSVNFIADVVCPWCYVGWRALGLGLAQAEAGLGRPVQVVWRAYQLDPDVPPEGRDRAAHLKRKYPDQKEKLVAMAEALRDAAHELGLVLPGVEKAGDETAPRLGPQRQVNSLNAHRLIRWSRTPGVQADMIERLFHAYHVDGADISAPDALSSLATELGMDGALVGDLLAGDADIDTVREETLLAGRLGLPGAPVYLVMEGSPPAGAPPGAAPQPAALIGAQSPQTLAEFLGRHGQSA